MTNYLADYAPLARHAPFVVDVRPHPFLGGQIVRVRYPNGFGASIVRHAGSYGAERGLLELAAIRYTGGSVDRYGTWEFAHEIIGEPDVVGHLEAPAVGEYLDRIRDLAPVLVTHDQHTIVKILSDYGRVDLIDEVGSALVLDGDGDYIAVYTSYRSIPRLNEPWELLEEGEESTKTVWLLSGSWPGCIAEFVFAYDTAGAAIEAMVERAWEERDCGRWTRRTSRHRWEVYNDRESAFGHGVPFVLTVEKVELSGEELAGILLDY